MPPEGYAIAGDFDAAYTRVLNGVQAAWTEDAVQPLRAAVEAMWGLEVLARALMETPLPDRPGRYGPTFRLVRS